MFHIVLDSFVENFEEITLRELSTRSLETTFDFGPYYIHKGTKIKELADKVEIFNDDEGNAIRSSLREWITDLIYNNDIADQKMERLLSIGSKQKLKKLDLFEHHGIIKKKSPVFDWLTISSINQGGN
jgi:hypothetical protein